MPSLLNTVRDTISQRRGNDARRSRGRNSRGGGSSLASQATGFIGGLLSGDGGKNSRSRGRRRR
jgi:hypothetical protein